MNRSNRNQKLVIRGSINMVPLKLLKENIYTHHLFDTLQIGVVKVEAHFQIEFQFSID